jgi:hypothetical protein
MPEITLYRVIFIVSLLVGIAFPLVTAVRVALIYTSMFGLMGDQQLQFLRELDKTEAPQQQTGPPPPVVPSRDLTLPALPDEGY